MYQELYFILSRVISILQMIPSIKLLSFTQFSREQIQGNYPSFTSGRMWTLQGMHWGMPQVRQPAPGKLEDLKKAVWPSSPQIMLTLQSDVRIYRTAFLKYPVGSLARYRCSINETSFYQYHQFLHQCQLSDLQTEKHTKHHGLRKGFKISQNGERFWIYPSLDLIIYLPPSLGINRTHLPIPICLPFRRAKVFFRHRAREWTVTGFRMISPSLISFRICWPGKSQYT